MGKGNNTSVGKGGGGGGFSRRRNAPDIVRYRKQRGRNEKFKGKKIERRVHKEQAEQAENDDIVKNIVGGFVGFVVVCSAFLAFVYLR
mmetsp:Transcript_24819/g.36412  ORF Transcript_24819/g.36412 Transcript_24819/m.36412 type:complete len:88 (+) Transcript_24819:115-378(+)